MWQYFVTVLYFVNNFEETNTQILQYQDAFQDFTPWACIYVKIQLDYTTSKISRKLINRPWCFVCLDVGFQSDNLLFVWIRPKKINQFHFLPRQDPRCPRGWAGEKAEGRAEKTDLEVEIPGSQTKDNGLKNIQELPVIALAAPPPPPPTTSIKKAPTIPSIFNNPYRTYFNFSELLRI